MRSKLRRALIAGAFVCLPACTTIGSAQRQAVRYNWAFNDARNEILLLNIVRAQEGEPLQFSTISTVTGPMRGSIGVTNAFEWIFHGADKLTPGGSFTFRDPAVTLTPLDSKEFRQGMMKPVGASYFAELLRQGWDSDVVKDLIVENAACGAAPSPNPVRDERRILVSAADAVKILREGAGDKAKLTLVTEQHDPEKVWVVMSVASEQATIEIDRSVCPSGGLDTKSTRFRSPLSMINYLGATRTYPHFQISPGRPGKGQSVLVATQHRDKFYYVAHGRKSAQTLALLAEIIGFQTMNATLDASKPTVTVPATD